MAKRRLLALPNTLGQSRRFSAPTLPRTLPGKAKIALWATFGQIPNLT